MHDLGHVVSEDNQVHYTPYLVIFRLMTRSDIDEIICLMITRYTKEKKEV